MEEGNLIEEKRNSNSALNPLANTNQNVENINYQTGYENVDNITNASNQLLNQSLQAQSQAIDTNAQTNVAELERQKEQAQQDVEKQNKAYYQEYQKQVNPYGVQAEILASQGLKNAGVAESTRTSIYNQYQKSITDNLNNLQKVSAEYDAQMAQVRSSADISKAEALSNMFLQQLDNIRYAYQLAEAQKQFEYQKTVDDRNYNYQLKRDDVLDTQWQKQFDYQKAMDDRNYNYQLQKDAILNNQWQQEFDLQKKKASSSSGRSSSGKSTENSLIVSDTSNISSDNLSDEAKRLMVTGMNALKTGTKAAGTYLMLKSLLKR